MPATEGASHARHGCPRERYPGPTTSRRMPATEGASHARHGCPRERYPGPTTSRRMPATEEASMRQVADWLIGWPERVSRYLTWLGPLFARITVGWVFLLSGWGKLH